MKLPILTELFLNGLGGTLCWCKGILHHYNETAFPYKNSLIQKENKTSQMKKKKQKHPCAQLKIWWGKTSRPLWEALAIFLFLTYFCPHMKLCQFCLKDLKYNCSYLIFESITKKREKKKWMSRSPDGFKQVAVPVLSWAQTWLLGISGRRKIASDLGT